MSKTMSTKIIFLIIHSFALRISFWFWLSYGQIAQYSPAEEKMESSQDFCPTGSGKFQPSLSKACAPEICNSIL